MLTIKYVKNHPLNATCSDSKYYEGLLEAEHFLVEERDDGLRQFTVTDDMTPGQYKMTWCGHPSLNGPNEIFVMNRHGKTVGVYRFDDARLPAASGEPPAA